MEETTDEIQRLQACINDLISVLAIPAVWSGREPAQIASTLLDVLLRILRLDFAYARLKDPLGGVPIELARLAEHRNLTPLPQEIGQALNPWLEDEPTKWPLLVRNPIGEGDVSIVPLRLGLQDRIGIIVAGSQRADFPAETERLLLRIAANQATIALQEARAHDELERLVAERAGELVRANESLHRSETYLAEAQRLSHTGSWAFNIATRGIVHWSQEYFRILGFDLENGMPSFETLMQRIHPDDRASAAEVIEIAIRERTDYEQDFRIILPDGTTRYMHAIGHPVFDSSGDSVEFVGTVMDVTERKLAEEALRKSEGLWRAVFENSAIGVALADPLSSRFLASNFAFQKMLGYTEEEIGKLTFMELTHEDYRESNWELITELLEGKRKQFQIEKQYWRKDGSLIWVSNNVSLVPGTKSMPRFIMALSEDITERKRTEEALRKTQAELAHVTRVATLGELTASIAHEINQPLGAIVNNASACLRWLTAQKLEEARQSAALAVADGHRAGEIIARIRALAKKAPPQKDWLDVNETIHEVIALARSEMQRNNIALETRLSENVPVVLADRIQLQQVILNLIINAIEAMSGAGDGPRELLVRSGTDESQVVLISVQDSGPGFDPKSLDHLFDAFYTTKPQGLGMGLAISRSIINAHGGRLWATANDDRGATFHFTLPSGGEKVP
jgi:PAS domain S-box-containing protein